MRSRLLLPALLCVATLFTLNCGESTPSAVDAPFRPSLQEQDLLSPIPGLVRCHRLPADSVTLTIGPAGGTLRVGPHVVSVPPGALASDVTITAVAPSSTLRSVRFQPTGLDLLIPATLTMSYEGCEPQVFLPTKRIALTTDDLRQILSFLGSVDDGSAQTVTGHLVHFSTYAVAW